MKNPICRGTVAKITGAALAFILLCWPAKTSAGPSAENPNGLPCTDGPDYRSRMQGPWSPGRYDGDPVGIRYSPRWDIFYYAQCLDPGTPGALQTVLADVIADGKIAKDGCDGGRAIVDKGSSLQLCADEADSYVTISGSGDNAVWVVGYYSGGAPRSGGGGAPSPAPRPSPSPSPAPGSGSGSPSSGSTGPTDYVVGDDPKNCPAPDPTHPYRSVMFGFDLSRLESAAGTPKYAFAALAQDLPPTDACLRLIAKALAPTLGCLDPQDNFMLDVTRDGYVGYRTWSPGYPHWSWFGYNSEHPDPGDAGPAGNSPNCGTYNGPLVHQK
jgi:hypothetical protein